MSIRGSLGLLAVVALVSCAAPAAPTTSPSAASSTGVSGAPKKTTVTLGVSATIDAFSYAQAGTTAGGGFSFYELWLQGLVTAGVTNPAPEARIAREVPSLDNGGAQLLPDGRMKVTWRIRPEVKWADGADLTAHDYVFGFEVVKDRDNPMVGVAQISTLYQVVESVEAIDAKTLVVNWSRPHYQFDAMGFALQPFPSHVLRAIWDQRNLDAMANHPYWREDYFQVGPYRPVKFEPAVEIILEPVPGYFLGKPKIDRVIIKQFADPVALYAAVQARTIDVTPENALRDENAIDLKAQWERSGEGTVYIGFGGSRAIFPQFKPELQAEPALFDPRVRQALMVALDREAWTGAMLAGQTQNTTWSLLPPGDRLYEVTKDSYRAYAYNPQQALRLLDEAGWVRGSDGALANRSDGRRLRIEIRGGTGSEASILADGWKQLGVDAPQQIIAAALLNDREVAQNYTGVEIAARGYGDQLLTRAECANRPIPPRFSGLNRGHYCNSAMDDLIGNYRASLTTPEQARWMREIVALYTQELPAMQLFFGLNHPSVVKGFNALQADFAGGLQPSGFYGSYFRNSHLWEWTS